MLIFITRRFAETADRLVASINAQHGANSARLVIKNNPNTAVRSATDDHVVCWGMDGDFRLTNPVPTERQYNTVPKGKLAQFRAFGEARVPCPPWLERPWEATEVAFLERNFLPPETPATVLARRDHQFGGRGITPCQTVAQQEAVAQDTDFYTLLIPKIFELRAHVAFGQVISLVKKTPGNPLDIAWNHETGGRQTTFRNEQINRFVSNLALDACKSVGYAFGAVDIIYDRYGRPLVLEVNSAPAITVDDRLALWTQAFIRVLDGVPAPGEEEEEPLDLEEEEDDDDWEEEEEDDDDN